MGLLGILVGLGFLIWLAYKGWSVLLLAPAAALLAAAAAGQPLLAHWTQTFMGSGAILSVIPARRPVRQAHGGQRIRRGHRPVDERAIGPAASGAGRGARW